MMSNQDDPLEQDFQVGGAERVPARTDDEYRRDREREMAMGDRRHYGADNPQVRSLSRVFRRLWTDRARLEIICRRRLIAKVLERENGDGLEVAMEGRVGGAMVGLSCRVT